MNQILEFIKTNKRPLMQIGGAVVGALLGVGVTALIMSAQDTELFDFEESEAEDIL